MDTVTAGNIAIVNFMGEKIKKSPANGLDYVKGSMYPNHLQYHTSWDWLMPVCEKCRDILNDMSGNLVVNGFGRLWGIYEACQQFEVTPVWLAVVDFINWYQTNKTS